jgi:hypothetical protein
MSWLLDLVDQGHGVVLAGDVALAGLVDDEVLGAGAVGAGPLAGLDSSRRAERVQVTSSTLL